MAKSPPEFRAVAEEHGGFTALEYGLIFAFVGMALIAAIPGLASGLFAALEQVSSRLT